MSEQEIRRDLALTRMRLVAVSMARIHQGLVELGNGKLDALAEQLGQWTATLLDVERTLRAAPHVQPSVLGPDPLDEGKET